MIINIPMYDKDGHLIGYAPVSEPLPQYLLLPHMWTACVFNPYTTTLTPDLGYEYRKLRLHGSSLVGRYYQEEPEESESD